MTRWRYRRAGRGTAVVLQHGFLCGSGYFQGLADALSDRYDVIVPTLPGFADHAPEPALDSIASFADYLLELLDHAGVDRFHLLGHSMGGMIAQETALKSGTRIDRLILFGTGPIGEMPGRFESLAESRRRVEENGPEDMLGRTVATWFMRGREDPSFPEILATARKASRDAILGGYRAMQDWRSLERLGDIRNPTLIVWGDGDRSYRRDQVDLLRRGIPGSRLAVMTDCSHNAHLEKPGCFHDCVADFLDG